MSFRRVSPDEAKALIDNEGYVYLDVRSIPEFAEGHPEGAYNVPLMHMSPAGMQANAEFLSVMEKAFDKAQKVVVGCKASGRSDKAAQMLVAAGFVNVIHQQAGWAGQTDPFGRVTVPGWKAQGLPTSSVPAEGRSYDAIKAKLSG